MSDTNWCTFCDCAVDPYVNSIYCSEECFKKDSKTIQRHQQHVKTSSFYRATSMPHRYIHSTLNPSSKYRNNYTSNNCFMSLYFGSLSSDRKSSPTTTQNLSPRIAKYGNRFQSIELPNIRSVFSFDDNHYLHRRQKTHPKKMI
ncbi:hypothetical protein K501DRAFT_272782 [Backusella circina FSU 941]|nr:hypothetical protein K501DRAFT_272782 [Backusella circina FSU 941]